MCQIFLPGGTRGQLTSGKQYDLLVSFELRYLIVHDIRYDSAGARFEVKVSLRVIAQPIIMMNEVWVRMVVTTTSEVCDGESGQSHTACDLDIVGSLLPLLQSVQGSRSLPAPMPAE